MKILLTGGAGFIGYHTTLRLLELGHSVVLVDNLNEYYDVTLKKARLARLVSTPKATFHRLDVVDYAALYDLVKNTAPDLIIHLAAIAGVRYSLDHGDEYIRNNVMGTYNVFEIAKRLNIQKIIYASSSSVYGANTEHPSSEDHPVEKPISLYAATKKDNELLAHVYNALHGIRSIGLRFFTVYGPWGRPDMSLFLFSDGIAHSKPISVYNEGKMKRDFTYVDDIVSGIIASIGYDTPYALFNLGSGESVDLMDFIRYIENAFGKKAIIDFQPMQMGDIQDSLSDITKAKTLLEYRPKTSAREGVLKFVQWYKEYYHVA